MGRDGTSRPSSVFPVGYELAFLQPTKYLYFEQQPNPGRKTSVWNVVSMSSGDPLGQIRWHGAWRQYCFFPCAKTLYNTDCLVQIADRIETCTRWHRNIAENLAGVKAKAANG